MYDIFRFLRAGAIISFIIYLVSAGLWFVIKFIVIPIFIFNFTMKIFSSIKIKKKQTTQNEPQNKNKEDHFIDAEYEDLD